MPINKSFFAIFTLAFFLSAPFAVFAEEMIPPPTPTGSISGNLFNDWNGNGIKDVDESGLSGWTVNIPEITASTTVTDSNGDYKFENLSAGTYSVCQNIQPGFTQTLPFDGISCGPDFGYGVNLSTDEATTTKDFGNYLPVNIFGGTFVPTSGNASSTNSVYATGTTTINIDSNSVEIDPGTIITSSSGSFDMGNLMATSTATSTISGLGYGKVSGGVLKWGLESMGLEFDKPIHIKIYVGVEFDGQSLEIVRSLSTTGGWTTDGLSSTLCIVSGGFCSFDATKASYYLVITLTPQPATISFVDPTTPADGTILNVDHFFATTTGEAGYSFLDINDSIVAWYTFENVSGTSTVSILDVGGKGNNATAIDNATTTTSKFGSGLLLDGVDDYMQTSVDLDTSKNFSASMWFNPSSFCSNPLSNDCVLMFDSQTWGNERTFEVVMNLAGNVRMQAFDSNFVVGTSTVYYVSGSNVSLNTWNNVVVSYDESNYKLSLFVNGQLTGSTTISYGLNDNVQNMTFGARTDRDLSSIFKGKIDDTIIFNRALGLDDVKSLYGLQSYGHEFTGLADGVYKIKAYAVGTDGTTASTETRTITISATTPPVISFVTPPTPTDGSTISVNNFQAQTAVSGINGGAKYFTFLDFNNTLLAWYKFDDIVSSTTIPDSSGKGNNATFENGTIATSTGKYGAGILLNVNNGYATTSPGYVSPIFEYISTPVDVKTSDDFTLSIWVKPKNYSEAPYPGGIAGLFTDRNPEQIYELLLKENGKIFSQASTTLNTVSYLESTSTMPLNDWRHVVMTYEASSQNLSMYINGALEASTTILGGITDANQAWIIGANTLNTTRYFEGTMDEIMIFGRTLNSAEVAFLYGEPAYDREFTNLAEGVYKIKAYVMGENGKSSSTEERTITYASTTTSTTTPPGGGGGSGGGGSTGGGGGGTGGGGTPPINNPIYQTGGGNTVTGGSTTGGGTGGSGEIPEEFLGTGGGEEESGNDQLAGIGEALGPGLMFGGVSTTTDEDGRFAGMLAALGDGFTLGTGLWWLGALIFLILAGLIWWFILLIKRRKEEEETEEE